MNPSIEKQEPKTQQKNVEKSIENTESKTKIREVLKEKFEEKPITNNTATITKDLKNIQSVNKTENPIESKVTEQLQNEAKPFVKKEEKSFERTSSSNNRSNLKIRETSFVDKDKKPLESKFTTNNPSQESLTKRGNVGPISPANNLSESLDIDEILTKIESDNSKSTVITEPSNYENEIVRLRKKLKRNILISAALLLVLIVTAGIIFLQLEDKQENIVKENKNPQKPVVEQANLLAQNELTSVPYLNDLKPNSEVSSANEVKDNIPVVDKKNEPVVSLPPLKDVSPKEESTYFAIDKENALLSNTNEEKVQIAAAKTEKIVPPKEDKRIEEEPAFFVAVEEMPELIGGIKGLQSKIVYPEIARRVGVEGKVIVQAIVDENGNVISTNILKGIGSGCDEVALDAVNSSKFTPGKQRGKKVKTQITIPITFKK